MTGPAIPVYGVYMANKRMNFSLPSDVADHLTRAQRQSRYLARLVREATGRVRAGLALLESAGWSPGQRAAAIDAVIASGGEDVDVVSALGHQPLLVELSLPERVRGRPELAEALLVLAREWSLGTGR